ncbi:MAG: ABC transporter permease, partial [Acidimicrobiia bacterium]
MASTDFAPAGGRRRLDELVERPEVRRGATLVAGALFFYWVLQRLWPAPIGVLVQGMVIGGLTALIAFGLALIYRSNRIINFAQGDLGGVPASLAVLLVLGPGINYFLAVPIGLAAAITLGALVEFLIIRRFFNATRLILTVATIGVSLILAVAATLLPRAFGLTRPPSEFTSPFDFHFNIGTVVFRGNEVLAMLTVPVVIAALAAFFRYTNIGIAVRASAESADRAALLGVPVKGIQTIVWVIATVLAFVAIFLRAGIVGLPIGSVLGPTILIRALTAGVLGRMEKLPTIFVASLGLGIVESSILFTRGDPLLADGVLFLIVLGALRLQRRGKVGRVGEGEASNWQSARDARPVPQELLPLPEVRWGIRAGIALVAGVFILAPFVLSDARRNLLGVILIFVMVGLSLVVLTGWAGQVSLGQVAFLAVGAAVAGYLTSTRGWDISLAVIAAGLAGAVAAMVIGLPALRIQGLFLAVVTLAFALATSSYLLNPAFIHWLPTDRIDRPPLFGRVDLASEDRYYFFCLATMLLTVLMVRGLRRSRTGRVLIAIRENPRAAQSYGVNATAAKLLAFGLSGFIAAFAGGVFVHHQQQLGLSAYSVDQSRDAFVMIVIGGVGSIPGAFLGPFIILGTNFFSNVFPEFIAEILTAFVSSVGILFVLLVLPGGFSQVYYGLRDNILRRIADRRGIVVPSLLAD